VGPFDAKLKVNKEKEELELGMGGRVRCVSVLVGANFRASHGQKLISLAVYLSCRRL